MLPFCHLAKYSIADEAYLAASHASFNALHPPVADRSLSWLFCIHFFPNVAHTTCTLVFSAPAKTSSRNNPSVSSIAVRSVGLAAARRVRCVFPRFRTCSAGCNNKQQALNLQITHRMRNTTRVEPRKYTLHMPNPQMINRRTYSVPIRKKKYTLKVPIVE